MSKKRTATGRLACGCLLGFRAGVEGSPITVVIEKKSDRCTLSIHVTSLPIYDHREALRPATRVIATTQPDFEEEG